MIYYIVMKTPGIGNRKKNLHNLVGRGKVKKRNVRKRVKRALEKQKKIHRKLRSRRVKRRRA